MLAVALGYFVLGYISLKLATINDFASPIWSPSGFAVGCLALGGISLAPGVLLGSFLINLTVNNHALGLFGIAAGNTLEAIIGALLITYFIKRNSFKNYSEMFGTLLVAILSSVVSATIGLAILSSLGIVGPKDFGYAWYTWWSGDAVGIMVILPFFTELILSRSKAADYPFKKCLGALMFSVATLGLTYLVFVKDFNQAFSWVLCPFLILSGMLYGKKLSRLILIVLSVYIVILTHQGHGPFEFGNLNLNLIYLQSLVITYALATLFVRPMTSAFKAGKLYLSSIVAGWGIVFLVIFMTTMSEKKHIVEDLEDSIHAAVEDIKRDATQYELLLEASKAVLQIKRRLYYADWKQYVESLDLSTNFPAMRGLGYIRDVEKTQFAPYLKDLKDLGVTDFTIKEFDPDYAAQFSNRYLITYIEPLEKNLAARGLDIGSNQQRRMAAEESKRLKRTVSTDLINLVQEKGSKAFSLFHPVWINQVFKGWVLAPVSSFTFFDKAFAPHSNNLNLEVTHKENEPFKGTKNDIKFVNAHYVTNLSLPIFGLTHQLKFYPTTEFFERHSHSSAPLAFLLSMFMLFMAAFLLDQMTFGQRAELVIQKRTEQLEESKSKLVYSSKMASLGEMASSMAHEINNPITIILGKIKVITFMLADMNVDNKLINDEIKKIEQTAGRISKIVKGLRSFSRVAENDPFELVPVEVIMDETLDLCSERLKINGITLRIDDIPEVCLFCRQGQITQVFMNMMNNSSDAVMDSAEKFIHWSFEIQEPDRILIKISDSGPGINPEIASRIMEPFFTTKSVGKGTGLGLSIAKGIIEDHGGQIHLDTSTPHSRFCIELPLKNV